MLCLTNSSLTLCTVPLIVALPTTKGETRNVNAMPIIHIECTTYQTEAQCDLECSLGDRQANEGNPACIAASDAESRLLQMEKLLRVPGITYRIVCEIDSAFASNGQSNAGVGQQNESESRIKAGKLNRIGCKASTDVYPSSIFMYPVTAAKCRTRLESSHSIIGPYYARTKIRPLIHQKYKHDM